MGRGRFGGAATALVGAVVAGDIQTAVEIGGDAGLALYGISGTVLVFSALTTVTVLGSVTRLTVTLQQRSYALWQLVGMGPGRIRAVVHAQLAVTAVIGSAAGCALALPTLSLLFAYTFDDVPQLDAVTPVFGPWAAAGVILYVLVTVTVGGGRGARRASRTPALRALREPEVVTQGMNRVRWLVGVALSALLASVTLSLPGKEPSDAATGLMLVSPLTAGLLLTLGPVLLRPLLRAWTGVLPRPEPAWWYLARRSTAHEASRSASVVNPLVVAVSLAGGLYASQTTVSGGERSLSTGGVVLLLGGPLLLALTGAAVTLFMSGGPREREVALVMVAGGTAATVLKAAAAEAVIYVVTAYLLAVPTVVATGLIGAWALDVPPAFGWGAIGVVATASLGLVLTAAVAPAALALRKDAVRAVAAE